MFYDYTIGFSFSTRHHIAFAHNIHIFLSFSNFLVNFSHEITYRDNKTIEKLRNNSRIMIILLLYVHVFGTSEGDESKSKCEDTKGGEDEGTRKGGERQRKNG